MRFGNFGNGKAWSTAGFENGIKIETGTGFVTETETEIKIKIGIETGTETIRDSDKASDKDWDHPILIEESRFFEENTIIITSIGTHTP